ncbi:hypothetical protein L2K70_04660 [Nocardioides KLBMP 9356]|uniref:Fibronectin type-III domain-containing protein n=1 Tax=Nocardioides potassii TaxID=2911371 RepID=A0ABS9H6N8_9ACTN|nr:hypothetical protein [Nocardioides potassii]MCF6376886.1 hypothetical protein [Nocardioides potassii]
MTFYTLTRPGGPWDYPTLGFTATNGAVLDGSLCNPPLTDPPDIFWAVGGSAESGITRWGAIISPPAPAEPETGSVLVYDSVTNQGTWTSVGEVIAAAPEVIAAVLEALGNGELLDTIAARIDGVQVHNGASGTLVLSPANGFHVIRATGPTTIELGTPPGYSIAFKVKSGAEAVTIAGSDIEVVDDAWVTGVYYEGAWDLVAAGAGGGGTVEPVTDPPTQPGTVTVDPTTDGYALTWVASTVAAGYEVQIDGGAWVDSGSDTAHTYTGLGAGSSHSGAVRAYNSTGERSTARTWGPANVDSVGLHEQLLAMNLDMYTRFSQGSIQIHDSLPGTAWVTSDGKSLPALNGAALSPGATGSAKFTTSVALQRTAIGTAFDSAQKLTLIFLVDAVTDPVARGGSTKFFVMNEGQTYGLASGETYYDNNTLKHLFVINAERDGSGNQVRTAYRDGVPWTMTFTPTGINATYDCNELYINTWQFGGSEGGFLLDFIALNAGEPVTQEQAQALAVAAGTYGNGSTA